MEFIDISFYHSMDSALPCWRMSGLANMRQVSLQQWGPIMRAIVKAFGPRHAEIYFRESAFSAGRKVMARVDGMGRSIDGKRYAEQARA